MTVSAQTARSLTVFIAHVPAEGVFIDPGVRDSMQDLTREIPKRNGLRLAATMRNADLVLFVRERHVSAGDAVSLTLPGHSYTTATVIGGQIFASTTGAPATTLMIPTEWKIITGAAYINVPGGGLNPIMAIGTSSGAWRGAARDLTRELERWVEANAFVIRALLAP